ncbi:hypothetical protein MSAN_02030100 [Mycena sanguinolenta]|uniref:Uncharacterized protein n=1 Tax=Mycena sanguinolenta TaxID=230812 RepID=A0A8H6XKJ7_9AGAR|nr:hypothetical protein MSAN_02030100 [Mycena sanguinolenta]
MDLKTPCTVDLSKAIKITNVRLSDLLAQHADQLNELDAEDPAPAASPAYSSEPAPPSDSAPETLKRPRPSSSQSLVPDTDDANENSSIVRKKKRPLKHKANRNAMRAQVQAVDGHTLKGSALRRVLDTASLPTGISLETHTIPVASTGWIGLQDSHIANAAAHAAESAAQTSESILQAFEIPPRRFLDREEALAEQGMRLITAEMQGPTTAIIDADNRVIIILNCGPTGATDWEHATNEASTAMDEAAKLLYGPEYDKEPLELDDDSPRRGPHYAVHLGTGMGGGQQRPTPFDLHHSVRRILTALFLHDAIARFVGLANVLFQLYAPKLYKSYLDTMEALQEWDGNLIFLAPLLSCVFACVTFNFGPQTVTLPHLDFLNLAWGWCFITALGWYDYKKGGHLIIWDLCLVIEFPPGATFAIPSAVLRHSNVSIQKGEKRFSITQYTSAGLFRFVNNGCKTDKAVKATMSKAEKREFAAAAQNRYSEGIQMHSTLEDLQKRAFM